MGKRRKNPVTKRSPAIYDDAYRLHEGEYYPQHHEANLQRLRENHPEYSAGEVETIYRQACRIEYEIEQWLGKMQLSEGSRQELLDWLEDHFYGFTAKSFSSALERVEARRVSRCTGGPHSFGSDALSPPRPSTNVEVHHNNCRREPP